jgi:hypothetical protein
MAKFKQVVIDRMESDADLFATVSKTLKIKPISLPQALKRNGNTLNQYSVVAAVAGHLGCEPDELLEKESTEDATK